MAPIMLTAQLLEVLFQESSHTDDPVSHTLDFSQPLLFEIRVVQDLRGNPGAVHRWIGVQWPHQNLDLRINALFLFS